MSQTLINKAVFRYCMLVKKARNKEDIGLKIWDGAPAWKVKSLTDMSVEESKKKLSKIRYKRYSG